MEGVNFPAIQIAKAIDMIREGVCTRVDVTDNVKVYAVKNVIRIDIKCKEA